MTTEELEKLLEGVETQTVDYKDSCPWDIKKFAKDILAMTNVQYGGNIIIGVKEKGGVFERVGISSNDRTTYKRDDMLDQMAAFADPHVNFSISFPKDSQGIEYVVITVQPFQEIPVICRKDSEDTKAGGIYYRSRNRRPESVLVSNAHDMRDIIERAAINMRIRFRDIGVPLPAVTVREMFNEALEERLKKERGEL